MSTRFHDKWHAANHFSVSGQGVPDAGRDPVASYNFPFEGEFIMNNSPRRSATGHGGYTSAEIAEKWILSSNRIDTHKVRAQQDDPDAQITLSARHANDANNVILTATGRTSIFDLHTNNDNFVMNGVDRTAKLYLNNGSTQNRVRIEADGGAGSLADTVGTNKTTTVGNIYSTTSKTRTDTVIQNRTQSIGGTNTETVTGNNSLTNKSNFTESTTGNHAETVGGANSVTITGSNTFTNKANFIEGTSGNHTEAVGGTNSVTITGNNTFINKADFAENTTRNHTETVGGTNSVTITGANTLTNKNSYTEGTSGARTETVKGLNTVKSKGGFIGETTGNHKQTVTTNYILESADAYLNKGTHLDSDGSIKTNELVASSTEPNSKYGEENWYKHGYIYIGADNGDDVGLIKTPRIEARRADVTSAYFEYLSAVSADIHRVDIKTYELSGYDIQGQDETKVVPAVLPLGNRMFFDKTGVWSNSWLFVEGDVKTQGNLFVEKNAKIDENTDIGGNAGVSGTLHVAQETTLDKDVLAKQKLTVNGNTFLKGTLDVTNDTTLHQNLFVENNETVSGNMSLSGNADISKNAWIGKTLTVDGDTTLKSDLIVSGDATVSSDLSVSGDATIRQDLNVIEDADIGGDLALHGDIAIDGKAEFKDLIYQSSGGTSIGENINQLEDTSKAINSARIYISEQYGKIFFGLVPVLTDEELTNVECRYRRYFSGQDNDYSELLQLTKCTDADLALIPNPSRNNTWVWASIIPNAETAHFRFAHTNPHHLGPSIVIGKDSSVPNTGVIAIGRGTFARRGGTCETDDPIIIGNEAKGFGTGISIGTKSVASDGKVAIGEGASAIGDKTRRIQLGTGFNNDSILSVYDLAVINNNGKINNEMLIPYLGQESTYVWSLDSSAKTGKLGFYNAVLIGGNTQSGQSQVPVANNANSIVIGNGARGNSANGGIDIAIGLNARTGGYNNSISIGDKSYSNTQGLAIGTQASAGNSYGIAIGTQAETKANNAIQIGKGINDVGNSIKVMDHLLMSGGKIPEERLSILIQSEANAPLLDSPPQQNTTIPDVDENGIPYARGWTPTGTWFQLDHPLVVHDDIWTSDPETGEICKIDAIATSAYNLVWGGHVGSADEVDYADKVDFANSAKEVNDVGFSNTVVSATDVLACINVHQATNNYVEHANNVVNADNIEYAVDVTSADHISSAYMVTSAEEVTDAEEVLAAKHSTTVLSADVINEANTVAKANILNVAHADTVNNADSVVTVEDAATVNRATNVTEAEIVTSATNEVGYGRTVREAGTVMNATTAQTVTTATNATTVSNATNVTNATNVAEATNVTQSERTTVNHAVEVVSADIVTKADAVYSIDGSTTINENGISTNNTITQTLKVTSGFDNDQSITIPGTSTTIKGSPMPSYVGMIVHSTTLSTSEMVKAIYGGTSWLQHSGGYFLLGANSGVSKNSASDNGGGTVTLEVGNLPTHTHGMSHTHEVYAHKHSIAQHNHTLGSHTHSVDAVTKVSSSTRTDIDTDGSGSTATCVTSVSTKSGSTGTSSATGNTGTGGPTETGSAGNGNTGASSIAKTEGTGSGTAFSVVPKYKNVYIWERTA